MGPLGIDWADWGFCLGMITCVVVMLLALLFAWLGDRQPPRKP